MEVMRELHGREGRNTSGIKCMPANRRFITAGKLQQNETPILEFAGSRRFGKAAQDCILGYFPWTSEIELVAVAVVSSIHLGIRGGGWTARRELLGGRAHSRSLGYARDDKVEGGGAPWHGWRWMDREPTQDSRPGLLAAVPFDELPRHAGAGRAGSSGLSFGPAGSHADSKGQRILNRFTSRLKSCPDTKREFFRSL